MQNLTAWKAFLKKHSLGEPKIEEYYTYCSRVFAKLPHVYLLRPGSPDLTPAATEACVNEHAAIEALADLMAGARVIRSGPDVPTLEVQAPELWLDGPSEPFDIRRKSAALDTLFSMVRGATWWEKIRSSNDREIKHLATECSLDKDTYCPEHFASALSRVLGSLQAQFARKQPEAKRMRKQRDAARNRVVDLAVELGFCGPRAQWPEQARLLKAKADALDRLAKHLHDLGGTEHWPLAPEDMELPAPQYEPERFAGTVLESLADKAEQRAVVRALRGRLAEIAEVLELSTEAPATDVLAYAKETVKAMRHASFRVDVGAPEAIRQLLAKRIEHSEVSAFLTGNLNRPRKGSLRDDVAAAVGAVGSELAGAHAQLNEWKRLVQPILEHRRKGGDNAVLAYLVSQRAADFDRLLSGAPLEAADDASRTAEAQMMWIRAQRVRQLMEKLEQEHSHSCLEDCDYWLHELGTLLEQLVPRCLELARKEDPRFAADPTSAEANETKGGDTHERQRDSRNSESASQAAPPPARAVGGDASAAEERRLLAKEVKRARRKHGLSTQGRLEIPSAGIALVPEENHVELHTRESPRQLDTPAAVATRDWMTEWIGDGDTRAEELDALATRQQKTIDEGRRRERVLRGAVEAMKPVWEAALACADEHGRSLAVELLFAAVEEHRERGQSALERLNEGTDFHLDFNGFAEDVERGLKRLKKQRGWDELSVDEDRVQRWLTSNLSPTAEAVTFRDVLAYVYMAFDALCRGELLPTLGGAGHLVDGEFQSDKYPSCPRGKVPLSTKDPLAQDLLWEYAERRRSEDASFAHDLQLALDRAGYERNQSPLPLWRTGRRIPRNVYAGDETVCQTHLESDARTMVDAVNLVRTGCLVSVVRPALFTFQSFDDWKKRGKELYAEHYVRMDNTLALDARGRPCMVGAHLRRAEKEGAYPVSVYALTGEPREGSQ